MSQPDLLLEFQVVALDAPAQLGQIDEPLEADRLGQRGQPILGRFGLAFRPLDEQPFLGADGLAQVVAMRRADAAAGETAGESLSAALAPRDGLPSLLRQLHGERLDRHRLVRGIAAQPLAGPAAAGPGRGRQGQRTRRPNRGGRHDAGDIDQAFLGDAVAQIAVVAPGLRLGKRRRHPSAQPRGAAPAAGPA